MTGARSKYKYINALRELCASSDGTGVDEGAKVVSPTKSAASAATAEGATNPLSLSVNWLRGVRSRSTSIEPVNKYQDEKDIKRDSLVVNGKLYVGAEAGYTGIVEAIAAALGQEEALVPEEYRDEIIDKARQDQLTEFAYEIVSASNRTESGGESTIYFPLSLYIYIPKWITLTSSSSPLCIHPAGEAYDSIDYLMKHDLYSLIRPNSDQAPPLSVTVTAGPFRTSDGEWAWGARAEVEATTMYVICDSEDPTVNYLHLQATNRKWLGRGVGSGGAGGRRRDLGTISIKMTLPPRP